MTYLSLGTFLPLAVALLGIVATAGIFGDFTNPDVGPNVADPSLLIAAEMCAAYTLGLVSFLIGRRRLQSRGKVTRRRRSQSRWKVAWWISAVPFVINVGLFLYFVVSTTLLVDKHSFTASVYAFASILTFLMIPAMLLSAYIGLRLGEHRSSRQKAA